MVVGQRLLPGLLTARQQPEGRSLWGPVWLGAGPKDRRRVKRDL
ncbi:hypothetical protein KKC1_22580 [Calderihabitans maritimus]|uniref:Uncharacterized protein n=1 Tax=Calderihabitans maritimus TaxID=1246530 RepID=A0A1Z5HUU2_9FIRM|nr:hypothetical protein KKC1_22580 [Calderihabitans maritimus]